MTNSSPPSRTTVSDARTQATIRLATAFRSSSPELWPRRVVDDLEIVEVDEGDRRATVVAFGEQDRLRQPDRAAGRGWAARQRVVGRHELDAVFGELALDGDAGDLRRRLR